MDRKDIAGYFQAWPISWGNDYLPVSWDWTGTGLVFPDGTPIQAWISVPGKPDDHIYDWSSAAGNARIESNIWTLDGIDRATAATLPKRKDYDMLVLVELDNLARTWLAGTIDILGKDLRV